MLKNATIGEWNVLIYNDRLIIFLSMLCTCVYLNVCMWKLRMRMSEVGLNPENRIHPERLTQAYQWIHWYMKGHDGWRECVRVSVCQRVWEEEIYENKSPRCRVWGKLQTFMFARVMTSARVWFFHDLQTLDTCFPAAKTIWLSLFSLIPLSSFMSLFCYSFLIEVTQWDNQLHVFTSAPLNPA